MEKELDPIEIGNRIKSKLIELNLKQIDLVSLTGISKNAISNYVSGNRIPDTNSILLISKILNISIEWLLIGKNNSNNLSLEEKEILTKYSILTEKNKGKVENFIDERIQEQQEQYKDTKRDLA